MKKFAALLLAMIMVLSVVTTAMAENVIKIGIFEPFSGDNGAGGKQEVLGMRYANSLNNTVTIGGEEYTIELVEVDNNSSADKAVSAAQTLVDAGVSVVIGSYGSGVCIAAGDTFADAQVPAIGASCTNPSVTALCDYYWRICFLDPFQGSVMANFAESLGCKKVYVLTMLGDDYGNGLGVYFANAFTALGGEVITDSFPEGNTDFNAYLNNATDKGCDAIFAPSSTTYASLIVNQAAAMNIEFPILAGDTWENSVVLEAAAGKNVNVYMSTFFDENDDAAAAAEFVTGFKAWLNADASNLTDNGGNDIVAAVSALGFDVYNVAVAAIVAADSTDPAVVAEALPTLVYENAVTGAISFDETGDAVKTMAYIKYANPQTGAFDFVKTQTVAELN